jgi:hypothetical protein
MVFSPAKVAFSAQDFFLVSSCLVGGSDTFSAKTAVQALSYQY